MFHTKVLCENNPLFNKINKILKKKFFQKIKKFYWSHCWWYSDSNYTLRWVLTFKLHPMITNSQTLGTNTTCSRDHDIWTVSWY